MEIKNAVIKTATVEIEDHGLLTVLLDLEYGDSSQQGFGGYSLYSPSKGMDGINAAGHFIYRVLEIVGVRRWDELAGKTIRVNADSSHIQAIGHIIKNMWFDPKKEFESFKKDSAA